MGEPVEDHGSCDISPDMVCENLTILREFDNITNLVRNEDFLQIVPKAKLRRVKWIPMFNCLKQSILNEMIQDLTCMWSYENMSYKLEVLEKQKEKFANKVEHDKILWRPQLNDVNAQLRAKLAALLKKQITVTETQAKDYEAKVKMLQKILSARRGYLIALLLDIQMYQNKNEEVVSRISEKLENHSNLIRTIIKSDKNDVEICWKEKDMEINEIN